MDVVTGFFTGFATGYRVPTGSKDREEVRAKSVCSIAEGCERPTVDCHINGIGAFAECNTIAPNIACGEDIRSFLMGFESVQNP